jgi:hypothetical protein
MRQRSEEILGEDRLEDTAEVLDYLLGNIGKSKKTIH